MIMRILFTILAVSLLATTAFSQIKVTGKIIDSKKEPLEFANIVLQAPDTLFGTSANEQGNFVLQAIKGKYELKITMLGYDPYEKEITLQTDINLGEIQLSESAIAMKEVVIKARRITRVADRFIVNLAGDSTIFGKKGFDVLNDSPGVFVQERDGTISVNGKTGTQVYINERPLHLGGTDLVRYLQNLKAEDIVRIEVLPNAGAEYDASVTGGIIKIKLKRKRDDGMDGSVGVSYFFSPREKVSSFSPSYNMNYRNNRLSLYTQLNYNADRTVEHVNQEMVTWSNDQHVRGTNDVSYSTKTGQIRLGGVYDLNDKQSVGLELYYSNVLRKNQSFPDLMVTTEENQTNVAGFFNGKNTNNNYSASANYLLQLDSLGSQFKILLDYFHNKNNDNQNYNSEYSGYMNYDSIYRSNMYTGNNTYVATADLSLRFKNNSSLSTGLKYARNEMNNDILYEYQQETGWNEIDLYSSKNSYNENISAIYGLYSSHLWKFNYSLGLRGEYTHTTPWTNKTDEMTGQDYFDLFPSVNVMYPLCSDGKHSLVLNYNRTISRPSFNMLNPFRLPASDFLYIAGNPKLQPAFSNDASIALNLFYRYNLTVGMTDTKGAFGKVWIQDPNTQGVIIQTLDNIALNKTYYVAINGPVKPTKWWLIYLNMTGRRNEINIFGERRINNSFFGYMNNIFTLPKNYMLEIGGFYRSPFLDGSVKMTVDPQVGISLRKQFFNKKLSAGLYVNNIFDGGTAKVEDVEKDFSQTLHTRFAYRQFGISLNYSFQAGKSVKAKKIETGAAEEKARMKSE